MKICCKIIERSVEADGFFFVEHGNAIVFFKLLIHFSTRGTQYCKRWKQSGEACETIYLFEFQPFSLRQIPFL